MTANNLKNVNNFKKMSIHIEKLKVICRTGFSKCIYSRQILASWIFFIFSWSKSYVLQEEKKRRIEVLMLGGRWTFRGGVSHQVI